MKNKLFIVLFLFFFTALNVLPQRRMENLDRGLIATKVQEGVYINWRITGQEWYGVSYNLYRDGIKLNDIPISGASNFTDQGGTLASKYKVSAIVKGIEQTASREVDVLPNPWVDIKLREIPKINGVPDSYYTDYSINDITAADLDGDGEYELIVKRRNEGYNSESPFENKYYTLIEAYKMDGTHMWTIDLGPNMIHNVEINVLAFDFDGDGKAEIALRSSEGTIDGIGNIIGDVADENGEPNPDGKTNYRDSFRLNNSWFESRGPEFLSLYDGETGEELDRIDHIARQPFVQWGSAGMNESQLAHRATKFHYGAPYLDGKKPSVFISRGIYHRIKMEAYDVVNKKFVKKWAFDSESGPYSGQGNHNYSIADVDNDGCDEIVYGSMVVDHNGQGLYTTQLGHGDAIHVGNFDPYRKGIEVFACLENSPNWGASLRAAETGVELWHHNSGRDMGRCMAANISDEHKGFEVWDNDVMFSASERTEVSLARGSTIFRIFWDGDLLHELVGHDWLDGPRKGTGTISKFNNNVWSNVLVADGFYSSNDTKGTPSYQADLFGDWREEIIWRSDDDSSIRIFFTTDPTNYRIYTLMHDMQYRQAAAWQMCGYNQPPHVSYFVGERENILLPPPPVMDNQRLVFTGTNTWSAASSEGWLKDGEARGYADGEDILFDFVSMDKDIIALQGSLAPNNVFVNSTGKHILDAANGTLAGPMQLVKQGAGTLKLNGTYDFTGTTEVWDGLLDVDGELKESQVWLNLFGELAAKGTLAKGVTMRYGSILYPGGKSIIDSVTIAHKFEIQEEAVLEFDFGTSLGQNDVIYVSGDLDFTDGFTVKVNKLAETISTGDYEIITVSGDITGDITKIKAEGIFDYPLVISQQANKIILTVQDVRAASSIIWKGDKNNGVWDLAATKNFTLDDEEVFFVADDKVLFNDSAANNIVTLSGILPTNDITINTDNSYTIQGEGKLVGTASLTKQGAGKLTVTATNEYTGGTYISGGILEVANLPFNDNPSALGLVNDDKSKFVLDGSTLTSTGGILETTQPMTIGQNGVTMDASNAAITWNAVIDGGVLTKTGSKDLNLYGNNTHEKTIIKDGFLSFKTEEANPGTTVVIENGGINALNGLNSYSKAYWNIEVPEGKTGTIYLDGRCDYYGSLKGSGTLNIYTSYVRSILYGDWSEFTGTIVAGSYGNSAYIKELYFDNATGLPDAHLIVTGTFVGMYNKKGTTFRIGGIQGGANAKMTGAHAWEIGNKNTESDFVGTITAGSIIKVGTGSLTLTGNNTYADGTIIRNGRLLVMNTEGSATGTGTVTVEENGILSGTGSVGGAVIVQPGGIVDLNDSQIGQINLNGGLTLSENSVLSIEVDPMSMTSDVINTTNVVLAGTLEINGLGMARNGGLKDGDSFRIFNEGAVVSGSFSDVASAPGVGLGWDLSELQNGLVSVKTVTGVESDIAGSLKVYPNPVGNILNIAFGEYQGEFTARIISTSGHVISMLTKNYTGVVNWNVSELLPGNYVLEIVAGNMRYSQVITKE